MLPLTINSIPVYLASGATDMRKSIRGLSMEVHEYFEVDLFSGAFFAFCNRSRKIIKILFWDSNGFGLYMKRLERGCFPWPESAEDVLQITSRQFAWMLSGLDINEMKKIQKTYPHRYEFLS
jgi:transposase